LPEYGFLHGISKEHRDSRLETYKVLAKAVREGRKKYGDLAWKCRQEDLDSDSEDEDVGEDELGSEDSKDAPDDVGEAEGW
jgi:hypothetical protein